MREDAHELAEIQLLFVLSTEISERCLQFGAHAAIRARMSHNHDWPREIAAGSSASIKPHRQTATGLSYLAATLSIVQQSELQCGLGDDSITLQPGKQEL